MNIIKAQRTQSGSGGPGRPVDAEKDAAILEAARHLLFNKGPSAVSMEAVARLAGVSKATLYSRHANRDELIAVALELQAKRLQQGLIPAPLTHQDVANSLQCFCTSVLQYLACEEHLQFMRAIGGSSDLPVPLRHSLYQFGPAQMHIDVSRWLAALNANGLLVCPDPDFSAELLLGMLQGLRLLKAMYWVELHSSTDEIQRHAERISAAFIALHAVEQYSNKGAVQQ